jgi:hypothetical protein
MVLAAAHPVHTVAPSGEKRPVWLDTVQQGKTTGMTTRINGLLLYFPFL